MKERLDKALQLRSEGELMAANQILVELVELHPQDALVNYQCAWSFDVLGREREAIPYYEKAVSLGLSGEDLEGALLGMGSTYRTLGDYEGSQRTFRKGMELFPDNRAMKVFYAMTLYNLQQHPQAMEILLQCIAESSNDSEIQKYKRAILFYSDQLDKVWE
ncbi:tetratricopeptide repeat protein [Paenibacillus sp. P96]|uniref:Tetratricopeptide repeat protein n=1 Tax=Paenibacillus zeirhizosphaerae TaxID=2987519 RepID=A0ABT9FRH6_9BACL|nr:tetratricopeptide repeat protein [Paenibacillus sp. P96]MDP4097269.1 tetratricopeptide repeat protein [Paenibacillus sp. P96]